MSGRRNSQQAVSAFWTRAKTQSKVGFDKLWATADKLGDPVNKLSNKIGSEAFWPTTLDKESEKAARILRSFCKDGFYTEEVTDANSGPQQKQKVLKRIPPQVIKDAKGLAIFTTMRTGLWVSGAGGSGVLVGRKDDGNWSQPVGIMLHTAGLGFLVGVDIYDCVLVLNTNQALNAFAKWRCTIGGEISAVAGPAGVGGMLETEVHKRQAPIFTYLKSRGFYAGVQIDGTVVVERTDEDEKFYGEKLSARDILAGKAQSREPELRSFLATLRAAEGENVDTKLLPAEPPPADMHIVEEGHVFGVPDREDPDPFGFHALEKEGFILREAGSRAPADSEHFDFKPSIGSPIYDNFRKSGESGSRRSSWRGSVLSSSTTAEKERERERERPRYVTSDSATQTDFPGNVFGSPRAKRSQELKLDDISPTRSPRSTAGAGLGIEGIVAEEKEEEQVAERETPSPKYEEKQPSQKPSHDDMAKKVTGTSEPASEDEIDEIQEAPVVHQVQQATRPQVVTKAKVVAVPKRGPPPKLPPRHPARARSGLGEGFDGSTQTSEAGSETASVASVVSVGKATSIRSTRRGSARDEDEGSQSMARATPTIQTPVEETPKPVLEKAHTSVGQSEPHETAGDEGHGPTKATPTRALASSPEPIEETRPPSATPKTSLERTPSEISRAATARVASPESAAKSVSPPASRPRPRMVNVRQNSSGPGGVSALKDRFEKPKPAPIKTSSPARPTSSQHSANRSSSPLKQLSGYTTTAREVRAGRISPATSSPQLDKKDDGPPGTFPAYSLDGASDLKPVDDVPQMDGITDTPVLPAKSEARSLRTGRSPLKTKPSSSDNLSGDTVTGSEERSVSPVKESEKGVSLAGIRSSLHPMRDDDDSDIDGRSRSVSPMKSPVKLDPEEDFS